MDDEKNLRDALEAIMAARRDELGDPPRPAELLAYRDGTLPEAERRIVEEKIAAHPGAARALLDLARFPDVAPAPGVRRVTEEEIAADWPALRARMAAERRQVQAGSGRSGTPARAAAALAAGLFLGSVGGYLAGRGPLAPPPEPTAGADFVVLTADAGPTRSEPGRLLAGRPHLLLVDPGGAEPRAAYDARLRGADGEVVWTAGGVSPTPEGMVTVHLPAGFLATGSYRLEIAAPGEEAALATFDLVVADDDEPRP